MKSKKKSQKKNHKNYYNNYDVKSTSDFAKKTIWILPKFL